MANKLQLTPARRRFCQTPRGVYALAVQAFIESGESEANIDAANVRSAYNGLRYAAKAMQVLDKVYVQRKNGELHLVRVG